MGTQKFTAYKKQNFLDFEDMITNLLDNVKFGEIHVVLVDEAQDLTQFTMGYDKKISKQNRRTTFSRAMMTKLYMDGKVQKLPHFINGLVMKKTCDYFK